MLKRHPMRRRGKQVPRQMSGKGWVYTRWVGRTVTLCSTRSNEVRRWRERSGERSLDGGSVWQEESRWRECFGEESRWWDTMILPTILDFTRGQRSRGPCCQRQQPCRQQRQTRTTRAPHRVEQGRSKPLLQRHRSQWRDGCLCRTRSGRGSRTRR
jgi:hypothetical protein